MAPSRARHARRRAACRRPARRGCSRRRIARRPRPRSRGSWRGRSGRSRRSRAPRPRVARASRIASAICSASASRYGWISSTPGLPSSCEFAFAPAWVWDIETSSCSSPRPVRSLIEARSAALVGRVLEPADVERDERELRPVTVERREDGGGRRQRPVDALGDVVRRRAPGAGVDPDRRRHVAPGDAERAVRGRECLLGHASTSRVACVSPRAGRPA